MTLRNWPLWRIALIWIAWPVSLVLLAVLTAIVIVWRAEYRATVRPGPYLPPQFSDFSIRLKLFPSILVWFGPPLLLTLVWLWQRSRERTRGA